MSSCYLVIQDVISCSTETISGVSVLVMDIPSGLKCHPVWSSSKRENVFLTPENMYCWT